MSGRFETFLLRRLRREAACDAIDHALGQGWLMEENAGEDTEPEDRQTRGIGQFFLQDDEKQPRVASRPRLVLGPKLDGLSREEIARLLARSGIVLDASCGDGGRSLGHSASQAGAGAAARSSELARPAKVVHAAEVARAVRAQAHPPAVEDIAVALLLSEGLLGCGAGEGEVLASLRSPRPIVTLLCPVAGFESRFVQMLRSGLIVPRPVATAAGYEIRGWQLSFTSDSENATRVIVFPGRRFDADDLKQLDYQLGQAAAMGYPILAVGETEDRIPAPLRLAASLDIECPRLSAGLIGKAMAEALGPLPENLRLGDLDADASLLKLADLSLAIRAGFTHQRALEVLVRLGQARRKAIEEDEGEGDGSGKSGSGSSSSSWRSGRDRTVKGSGSDIIKPVPTETIASDPFVPTVERLHGYGDSKSWALDLKQDLELWRQKRLDWSALSPKLLLSGPPGTGKTSFAKALCNTLQVPLIATSVSTWLEASYLGDVVRRMKVAFEEASGHAPCILFIDEIDGIGRRGQGKDYDDYWNTVVNKALELLDGAVRSSGIVIVGATNHPDVIDPAILRSGRLETHIRIPPPDIDALAGILRHHLGNDFHHVIATRPDTKRQDTKRPDTTRHDRGRTDPVRSAANGTMPDGNTCAETATDRRGRKQPLNEDTESADAADQADAVARAQGGA